MILAYDTKSVALLIISLSVKMCVCDIGIFSCPKESGVKMEISGLVGQVRTKNGRSVIVESSKDVIVNCSTIPELTSSKDTSLQMSLNKEEWRKINSLEVWRKKEINPWDRKQVKCSLANTGRPVCSANLFLTYISNDNSSNCHKQPSNVTCQIGDWYSDATKTKSHKCVEVTDINPVYEFSMYLTANETWTSCDANMRNESINPPEYSNITCKVEQQQVLEVNETVFIQLRKVFKSTGFIKADRCEEFTYLSVSGNNLIININTDIGFNATTGGIVLIFTVIVFIFLFCCWKGRHKIRQSIDETSLTKHFVKTEDSNSSTTNSLHTLSTGYKHSQMKDEVSLNRVNFLDRSVSVVLNEDMPMNQQLPALKYDAEKFEISRQAFKLEYILGEGEYGTVYKATASGINETNATMTVAVKQVKSVEDMNQWRTITDELKILSYLSTDPHFNLVNLMKACTENIDKYELFLLLEYCPYGNLKMFLIDKRDKFMGSLSNKPGYLESEFNWSMLLTWSYSIASGMEYLASKNIMHGDLAARNILIGENYSAKISDFGLSKMMYYNEDYRKTKRRLIPLAWMALEYLQTGVFNNTSDVWSFGVTLWEIFSLGNKPYGLVPYETLKKNILDGERLDCPKPLDLHPDGHQLFSQVIQPCWGEDYKTRPSFSELILKVAQFLGEDGLQAYKREEFQYLNKKTPEKKKAPTGYVRMESIENQNLLSNLRSQSTEHEEEQDEDYYKTNEGVQVQAEPSARLGYIEMTQIKGENCGAETPGIKLSEISGGESPLPGYSRATLDAEGDTLLTNVSGQTESCSGTSAQSASCTGGASTAYTTLSNIIPQPLNISSEHL